MSLSLKDVPAPYDMTASQWGLPTLPAESVAHIEGNATAWVPGVKTDDPKIDWYLVHWDTYDLKKYYAAGGKAERLIIQNFKYDEKLEPYWSDLKKRAEQMKEYGVHTVCWVDLSAWTELPTVVQLYNLYRSAIVNRDLARAGFKVWPHPNWGWTQLHKIGLSLWPDTVDSYIVDAAHLNGGENPLAVKAWIARGKLIRERFPKARTYLWTPSTYPMQLWTKFVGGECKAVPSRVAMVSAVQRAATRVVRARGTQPAVARRATR